MLLPTPHLEELNKTLNNPKLPLVDKPRVEAAIDKYRMWIQALREVSAEAPDIIEQMVSLLNDYKNYVDVDLIFNSDEDFLYRQKGQLKLDNSIIEEFVPWLMRPPLLSEMPNGLDVGPSKCFSAIYFTSSMANRENGGGLNIRSKDQDFAISRRLRVRTSYGPDFEVFAEDETHIAYLAAEIKTNLDKTMFQEACATARDVRLAVPGSKYYVLCEWLDMSPLSTSPTDVDEVLILRKARRLNSNIRSQFSAAKDRRAQREVFDAHLENNPLRPDVFQRFIDHINALLSEKVPVEDVVLENGFF